MKISKEQLKKELKDRGVKLNSDQEYVRHVEHGKVYFETREWFLKLYPNTVSDRINNNTIVPALDLKKDEIIIEGNL